MSKLRNMFREELQNNKVTLEVIREKLSGDDAFNASVRQTYDKLKRLLSINTVASTVSYLPCFPLFIFFRLRNNLGNRGKVFIFILLLSLISVGTCKRLNLNFTLTNERYSYLYCYYS